MSKVFAILLCLTTAAQASPGLSPSQITKLRTFGPKVVVADFIPPGFRLVKVEVTPPPRDRAYTLTYRGPGKAELSILGAFGGMGGGYDRKHHPFTSPLLGKSDLEECLPGQPGYEKGSLEVATPPQPLPGQRLPAFWLSATNIQPQLAIKIARSFKLLK